MTPTYVARRLLEHGPLKFAEFQAITGWPAPKCSRALKNLRRSGKATCVNHERHSVWRLV